MPKNKVSEPTNYRAAFASLAADAEIHLVAVEAIVARAYELHERLITDVAPCERWSQEQMEVEEAYGFWVLQDAINAVDPA